MLKFESVSTDVVLERGKKWDSSEDQKLRSGIETYGEGTWTRISESIPGRSPIQCYNRWMKILKPTLVKGRWTEEEDTTLRRWVEVNGPRKWSKVGIAGRNEKQCRERWINVLSSTKKREWTVGEDRQVMEFYINHGPKWHLLSQLLPGRSPDTLKNRLNSNIRKMLNAKSAKIKISIVPDTKGPDDKIGRYEIVMTYEEFIKRKSKTAMIIADMTLNEAAELILKSKKL